jgi:hypothetical protein
MSTYPATNLYSTAPYLYSALLQLCTDAGQLANPYVYVAPFELEQYEPGSYIILQGIRSQRMEVETLGSFRSMQEWYELYGAASVFVGDTPDALNPTVATTTMLRTYELFSEVVMSPAMSNTNAPVFGAASPFLVPGAVNYVAPSEIAYSCGPAFEDGGAPSGWMGRIDFAFQLRAFITPSELEAPI